MNTSAAMMRKLVSRIDWHAAWQYALLILTGASVLAEFARWLEW